MPVIKSGLPVYLETIYNKYNKFVYISTDPVLFLHTHKETAECELVGLIAAGLAYGRVAQIQKSIQKVLDCITLNAECLYSTTDTHLADFSAQFKHRFTTGNEIRSLILACKKIYEIHGSLYNCFCSHYKDSHETFIPALTGLINELKYFSTVKRYSLLPDPEKGNACKRLHLFLRWMIRRDNIDPGPWSRLPSSKLIIPLDTHMFRIAGELGFTKRKQADIKTAMEITGQFKKINPRDPVKYDFALTRIGMSGRKTLNKT